MKEIGGFFELELSKGDEYHNKAIGLNTARNSLEYILRNNSYNKVYIPYYICSSILEPLNKLNIEYEFYKIDANLNFDLDIKLISENSLVLIVNYFGINKKNISRFIQEVKKKNISVVVDNTQSFYSIPSGEDHTIYSARKFFGVPDGAYVYTQKKEAGKYEIDRAEEKIYSLINRIEYGAEIAYKDFKNGEKFHSNQNIKLMSNLTKSILKSINYEKVKNIRLQNFNLIHQKLKVDNKINIDLSNIDIPMVYPFYVENGEKLRSFLIQNKVFVAQYWVDVFSRINEKFYEFDLINNLIAIPIDQRYTEENMQFILNLINEFNEKKGGE